MPVALDGRMATAEGESEQSADGLNSPQQSIADNLGRVLSSRFEEWKDAKKDVEERWLEDMRAYNGEYDPEVESRLDESRSKVFVHLTRTKTLSAYARIMDLLAGHDRHWEIDPTPIPDLSKEQKMELTELIQRAVAAENPGAPIPEPTEQDMRALAEDMARDANNKMRTRIEDQLIDVDYDRMFKASGLEFVIIGNCALKGPIVRMKNKRRWVRGAEGFDVEETEERIPGLDAPSVFDLYPDPYASSIEDAIGIFERHVLTTSMLRDLGQHPGFNVDAIEDVITLTPGGNHDELDHEVERRRLAGVQNNNAKHGRFDVLEYWGQVSGFDLQSAGIPVTEKNLTKELQANVWFTGQRTIRTQLNPLKPQRLPYQIARFEKNPHQFWGIGVPRQMRDSQIIYNASMRTLLDNLAISSGPQVEVNNDLLMPGESPTDLKGWRVWLREGGDPQHPLLRFYYPENIAANLGTVMETARKIMDEETNSPSYTHGEQMPGLNKTASGMSMLMGASNISMKNVIKNLDDDLITPTISGFYDWNMQWSEDESIKGDSQVKAQGSTALLAKEVQSQRLLQYATMTNNPMDMSLIGPAKRGKILQKVAQAMDLNPEEVAPSDDDIKRLEAQQGNVAGGGGGGLPPNVQPGMGAAGAVSGAPPQPAPA